MSVKLRRTLASAAVGDKPARRLASVEEISRHLDVCQSTVYRRIADGSFTAYRIGRLLRLDLNEIDATLAVVAVDDVS